MLLITAQVSELTEEQKEHMAKLEAERAEAAASSVDTKGPSTVFHGKQQKDYQGEPCLGVNRGEGRGREGRGRGKVGEWEGREGKWRGVQRWESEGKCAGEGRGVCVQREKCVSGWVWCFESPCGLGCGRNGAQGLVMAGQLVLVVF